MNIFVCVKQVPDTETKIAVAADGKSLSFTPGKMIINPYDEFAIEEALKTKTAANGTVTVVGVGPKASVAETLRTALAMGADEAVVLDTNEALDNSSVAQALAHYLKDKNPGLIFTGKAAIDDNSMAVTQMLAEQLSLPHATVVSKFELQGDTATIEREIEGGAKEIIELKMPAVIGANKGLNTPRYASLPGIMKAKKKSIQEVSVSSLGVGGSKVTYSDYQLPSERPTCKILTGDVRAQSSELVRLLREEAKII